jgi:rhodanese-related sulfurtransferase
MRIAWPRFLTLSALGGALWVGSGLAAGVLFKTQIQSILVHLDRIGSITGTVVAAALLGYVLYKWWERRRFYEELRMARMSVADLYALMEAGQRPIVVDVRSNTARTLQPRWIPGAIHVPVDDVARHIADLPRDREIVVYCTCPSEASAARVAKVLMNHGFREVRPLHGGLDAWIEAGYAVDGTQVDGTQEGSIMSHETRS